MHASFPFRPDFLDQGLAAELSTLFAGKSVVELGAGTGCYASTLRRHMSHHRRQADPSADARSAAESVTGLVRAFDGNPGVVRE